MTRTVTLNCDRCGSVKILASSLHVATHGQFPHLNHYYFFCTNCRQITSKKLTAEVYARLAPMLPWVIRETVVIPPEALEVHMGPDLTEDDYIEFGRLLYSMTDDELLVALALTDSTSRAIPIERRPPQREGG